VPRDISVSQVTSSHLLSPPPPSVPGLITSSFLCLCFLCLCFLCLRLRLR
jgi:hypothetical protein